MIKGKIIAGIAVLAISLTNAYGAPFSITNVRCAGTGGATENTACTSALSSIRTEFDKLATQVNSELPDVDGKRYASGMANSVLLTTKGLTVDYASNISIFAVGGGLGLGFDPGDKGISNAFDKPAAISGIGAQVSGMLGLNLGLLPFIPAFGPIDLKKGILFVNFMSMDMPGVVDELSGSFTNIGVNIRYKAFEGMDLFFGLVGWSRVDVTTGINYSKMKVQVKAPITQTVTQTNVGGSGQNLTGTFKGDAVLGPEVGITSIPIEVSSAVTALYLLKLYAGLGADITVGSADMVANLQNQSLTGKIGTGGTAETVNADVNLDLGGSSGPDFFAMRAFLGMHLDFKVLNIFVQANHSFTTGAYGVTTGARVYF